MEENRNDNGIVNEIVSEDGFVVDAGEVMRDEQLENVTGGGHYEGGYINLKNAPRYETSYGEGYAGTVSGNYKIQRIIQGRKCPYLLFYNVGWVANDEHVIG